MARPQLVSAPAPETVAANLARVEGEIARALSRRRPAAAGFERGRAVEILAATKYVASEDMPLLAQGGVRLVGENRAQDLERKFAAHGPLFEWDFIGALQSRKVRMIVPLVRLIHSVASDSALAELERRRASARPGLRLLIEVNLSGEEGKAGIAPERLGEFLARAPLPVAGLMTMPPLAGDPELSRPWFARLRELADAHGLRELSMGTSQDYPVAVEEGATIVRIGTTLYAEHAK